MIIIVLEYSMWSGQEDIAKMLLDNDAKASVKDNDQATPLDLAVKQSIGIFWTYFLNFISETNILQIMKVSSECLVSLKCTQMIRKSLPANKKSKNELFSSEWFKKPNKRNAFFGFWIIFTICRITKHNRNA